MLSKSLDRYRWDCTKSAAVGSAIRSFIYLICFKEVEVYMSLQWVIKNNRYDYPMKHVIVLPRFLFLFVNLSGFAHLKNLS